MIPYPTRLRLMDGGHCYLDAELHVYDGKVQVRRMPSALNRRDVRRLQIWLSEVLHELDKTNPDHDNVIQSSEA